MIVISPFKAIMSLLRIMIQHSSKDLWSLDPDLVKAAFTSTPGLDKPLKSVQYPIELGASHQHTKTLTILEYCFQGFAYVEFLEADAVAAACLLADSELHGRALKVIYRKKLWEGQVVLLFTLICRQKEPV